MASRNAENHGGALQSQIHLPTLFFYVRANLGKQYTLREKGDKCHIATVPILVVDVRSTEVRHMAAMRIGRTRVLCLPRLGKGMTPEVLTRMRLCKTSLILAKPLPALSCLIILLPHGLQGMRFHQSLIYKNYTLLPQAWHQHHYYHHSNHHILKTPVAAEAEAPAAEHSDSSCSNNTKCQISKKTEFSTHCDSRCLQRLLSMNKGCHVCHCFV